MSRIFISALIMFALAGTAPGGQPQQFTANRQLSATRQKVKAICLSQIGIREQGHNSGKEIEKYLSYVKLRKGDPWCAAFVCWVLGEAGLENPRSGWSPDLFPAGRIIWRRQQTTAADLKAGALSYGNGPGNRKPESGDVFGLFFPEKGRIAHAGFVDEWDESWLITVEGNTNASGSREGDGVYRKRRLQNSIYRVSGYIPY